MERILSGCTHAYMNTPDLMLAAPVRFKVTSTSDCASSSVA
jgi:hypothetical protein